MMTHIIKYVLSIAVFCMPAAFMAQAQHTIKGTVTDKTRREPLPYAAVQIYGTGTGAITDSTGHFRIPDVNPGIYRLQISSLFLLVVLEHVTHLLSNFLKSLKHH